VIALLTMNWTVLLLPAVALIGALVISRGRYWWIITSQVSYLRHYYKVKFHEQHDWLLRRNNYRRLWRELLDVRHSQASFKQRCYNALYVMEHFTLFQLIYRHYLWVVTVIVCLIASIVSGYGYTFAGLHGWLLAWALAPLAPFFVTSLRRFLFLGEADRYIEFAVVPSSILAALLTVKLPLLCSVLFVLIYVAITTLVLYYEYNRLRRRSRSEASSPERDSLFAFLRTLPSGSLLLVIPFWLCLHLVWRFEHKFLAAMDGVVWSRDWDKLFWKYPLPSRDLAWWRSKYGMQYVVLDKGDLHQLCKVHKTDFQYNFTKFTTIFENAAYTVYRSPEIA
jgi:hypothetical protein